MAKNKWQRNVSTIKDGPVMTDTVTKSRFKDGKRRDVSVVMEGTKTTNFAEKKFTGSGTKTKTVTVNKKNGNYKQKVTKKKMSMGDLMKL